ARRRRCQTIAFFSFDAEHADPDQLGRYATRWVGQDVGYTTRNYAQSGIAGKAKRNGEYGKSTENDRDLPRRAKRRGIARGVRDEGRETGAESFYLVPRPSSLIDPAGSASSYLYPASARAAAAGGATAEPVASWPVEPWAACRAAGGVSSCRAVGCPASWQT